MTRNSDSASCQRWIRKYAMPSASRIEAFSGSRRFAFSSATVACAAWPFLRWVFPCWKRSYVSCSLIEVRKILPNHVYRMRQVARSRDDDGTNIRCARERVRELERRPGKIVEERHELDAEAPQRNPGQTVRIIEEACDALVEARLAVPRGHGTRRLAPLREERLERAVGEDVVGAGDERRRLRAAGERAAHGVGRTVRPRLAGVADARAECRAVAEQLLDLPGEVARDDRDVVAARGRKVAHQRRDHRTAVDRQDRLRPALADRPHAGSQPRGDDYRVHLAGEAERPQRHEAAYATHDPEAPAQLLAQPRKLLARTRRGRLGIRQRTEAGGRERIGEAAGVDLELRPQERRHLLGGRARRDADALVGEETAEIGAARSSLAARVRCRVA